MQYLDTFYELGRVTLGATDELWTLLSSELCCVAMAAGAANVSVPLARQLSWKTGHVCFTQLKMG